MTVRTISAAMIFGAMVLLLGCGDDDKTPNYVGAVCSPVATPTALASQAGAVDASATGYCQNNVAPEGIRSFGGECRKICPPAPIMPYVAPTPTATSTWTVKTT